MNLPVMAGLVPAVHDLDHREYSSLSRSWIAGTSPAMTIFL
jgi:hypothetical protein